MKNITIALFTSAFLSLLTLPALAKNIGKDGDNSALIGMSAFYYSASVDDSVTQTSAVNTIYDIKAGYVTNKGLFGGLLYTSRNDDTAGMTSTGGSQLGVSGGYYGSSGIHFVAHYILSATLGGFAGAYEKGSGIQADFGYLASATSNFYIGVDVSYRSLTYKEQVGNPLAANFKRTELFPMLSFMFTLK